MFLFKYKKKHSQKVGLSSTTFSRRKSGAGFTLIEIIVSLSIFVVVMLLIMGAILSALTINTKAQTRKTAIDNLDFAVDSMSRTIKFGTTYHCGSTGDITTSRDCASGATSLSVRAADGTLVTYTLVSGVLTRSINSGTAYAMTSPEITIQALAFRVFGSATYGNDYLQPQVILTISGIAGASTKVQTQSSFQMETTISQRKLDI